MPVNQLFNVWDHTLPEIYGIILAMFVKLDLVKCLNITEGELLDFIIDVDRGYLATYYHSFFHAADVTAVLYHILLDMNASQYLSKPDMAALLLAGLCHDIGHPGLNNLFQVNAKTELVQRHGETSVLEKYSCSLAMDLIDKHKLFRNIASSPAGILPEGSHATEQSMKESMVKAIMATDMSFHYDMLNNLNSLIDYRSASELTLELRQNLSNCLLHAADISNAVKPWTLCKRWSDLVVQEFFRQGDIEKSQQLPISPNMDRNQHNQPQISLGFGDFVVQPYFESFVEFLPEASPFLVALANNREHWVLMQKAAVEAEKERAPSAAESGPVINGETDTRVDVDTSIAGPITEIKDLQRVNSPIPAHLTSGRRVSGKPFVSGCSLCTCDVRTAEKKKKKKKKKI
ncbi:hypothetical protein BKA57DRAFT_397864 [Linnemannia elongata]|nr:hypothetical protein BKA57DRAFT_397864 [Linnemannia elongata]